MGVWGHGGCQVPQRLDASKGKRKKINVGNGQTKEEAEKPTVARNQRTTVAEQEEQRTVSGSPRSRVMRREKEASRDEKVRKKKKSIQGGK